MTIDELTEWRDYAACQYIEDPEQVLFFESELNAKEYPHEDRAKAICGVCPVRANCLDWALASEERWGIYGGMTFMERRKVVRRRKKNADLMDRLFNFIVKRNLVQNGFSLQVYGMQEVLP